MTATEYVVLVDADDQEIGKAEKLAAHTENLLHRAFSVFVFKQGKQLELLLQQRALTKYHSPGLWTNTCCSHPRSGEAVLEAAKRRLQEELGFVVDLKNVGKFQYNAYFNNGLSEHEIDHVLIGFAPADLVIHPNPDEVHTTKWITLPELEAHLDDQPTLYTPWIRQAYEIAKQHL